VLLGRAESDHLTHVVFLDRGTAEPLRAQAH
jgi:hypothetical protein